jgi:Lon protease-like protein
VSEIGLFPLPIVLLPTEQVPLHVFEDRYKELIGECLADDREFGFVYADDDGLREIGTRAGVTEVLARFDDGRLNVLVEGRDRFKLLALTDGRAFQTGDVEPVEDDEDAPERASVERALELFERLRELTGSDVETPTEPLQLSYALAARVELVPQVKQELLQETSERIRLERVCQLLDDANQSVERQRQAAERAATNGKVELG